MTKKSKSAQVACSTCFWLRSKVISSCCLCTRNPLLRDRYTSIPDAALAERSDILDRLVRIVASRNGITAGKAGFELWYRKGNEVRHENTVATMHCRAAGKLLARAERMGLVSHRQHGPAKLWYANKGVTVGDAGGVP